MVNPNAVYVGLEPASAHGGKERPTKVRPRFRGSSVGSVCAVLADALGSYAAGVGSGRTITVSAMGMISVTGRSARDACSRIFSGLDAS